MAELGGIRNAGVVVGGDVTRSTITVTGAGPADGAGDAPVLRELDELLAKLLGGLLQLPAEQVATVAGRAAQLKEAVHAVMERSF